MPEQMIFIGFCVWVLIQVYRGMRKGFAAALLGLLGFVLAYIAVYLWGADCAALVARLGIEPPYTMFIAYPVLFIFVSTATTELPLILFPSLKKRSALMKVGGAIVGGLSGVVTGLCIVWFAGLLSASFAGGSEQLKFEDNALKPALQEVADNFVAGAVEIGALGMGMEEDQAKVLKRVVRSPTNIGAGMQQVMQAPEMKNLMQSPDAIEMMAVNDVNSLQRHPEFKALMQNPGMESLRRTWQDEQDNGSEEVDEFIAEQLSFVWRRLQYLKHDPRVKAIMQDPEFQALAQKENPLAMMADENFRKLVGIIMEDNPDMQNIDFAALAKEEIASQTKRQQGSSRVRIKVASEETELDTEESEFVAPPEKYQASLIFKWRDDNGHTQYTDYENIPEHLRESAIRMQR